MEKEKQLSYIILAEYYNEENELVYYIVQNKYGQVIQVKKEILEKWN